MHSLPFKAHVFTGRSQLLGVVGSLCCIFRVELITLLCGWHCLSVCVLVLLSFLANVCATVDFVNLVFVSQDVSCYLPVILIGKLCNSEMSHRWST